MIARSVGLVVRTLGGTVLARLPRARIGEGVLLHASSGELIGGTVTAVDQAQVAVSAFGSLQGVAAGDQIETSSSAQEAVLGFAALGRALGATGAPLDTGCALRGRRVKIGGDTRAPMRRRPVETPFWTGVRAIDGLLTIGRGARIGVFGAPGAGKSTLLETIAASASGDAVVLALIGERGREAAAWMKRLDARTTLVCATSDRSAAERSRAAELAMAQALTLRERGLHVVLIVDSLARYCSALRELRNALGEPAGRGGYPPSVFADLARFVECAGNGTRGSITLIASVLSDGADEREPLSDAARSLLDGHVVLSAELARAGRYPAIDVLASASRTMREVVGPQHRENAALVRRAVELLAKTEEARLFGMMGEGDAKLRRALEAKDAIEAFAAQSGAIAFTQTLQELSELGEFLRARGCEA